ncbi:MAG TPA: type II toxin-antitoxin system death-on-curing family toxin [Acetobacteraceae bacterium]|nr:type II toxin-antitoxin system death-on-curing family toxin [Acetobacteraceae bacterium]
MTEPEFLEPDVVLFLHDQALQAYGGLPGVRDAAGLESALGRPINKWAYSEAGGVDLFDLAGAYAFGIASNHAFSDGNKRTAWACCVLFLKVNGVELDAPTDQVLDRMPRLASRGLTETEFAAWLRSRAR